MNSEEAADEQYSYAQGAVPGEEFEEKGRNYDEGIEAGKRVAIIGGMHGEMPFMNRCMLEDLLKFHKAEIHTSAAVSSIDANGLSYECGGEKHSCTVDTMIMAAGYTPVHELYDSLKDCGKPVYNIGDSRKVHNIMQAVWDGFEVGRSI